MKERLLSIDENKKKKKRKEKFESIRTIFLLYRSRLLQNCKIARPQWPIIIIGRVYRFIFDD